MGAVATGAEQRLGVGQATRRTTRCRARRGLPPKATHIRMAAAPPHLPGNRPQPRSAGRAGGAGTRVGARELDEPVDALGIGHRVGTMLATSG